ncbi:MAG: hypothetical protein ABS87_08910 [Sphingomonas sp. SCN 67-18]|uniref:DUF4112 domain-containing protein n=1 Tax=uncultured Sphingomonas sp. TaxID=158754 RepID=UPI00086ED517|nr:DUF4112 domain-containing protein [Sphingomonas sp. SCN 67-18]ODU20807.1 MAG: hypothetical protein ABS87_08910 [Sphingomonas sp. SCN 67-18]
MPLTQEQIDRLAGAIPDMGRDPASIRRRIEAMEALLERMFTVPGLNRQIGLDSIVGLIPVVGDLITAAMGAWIVWEARNLGMSKFQLTRMAANIGIDSLVGAVPVVGDLFDFVYRSNSKNLKIIKRHLDKHHPATAIIDHRPAGQ